MPSYVKINHQVVLLLVLEINFRRYCEQLIGSILKIFAKKTFIEKMYFRLSQKHMRIQMQSRMDSCALSWPESSAGSSSTATQSCVGNLFGQNIPNSLDKKAN